MRGKHHGGVGATRSFWFEATTEKAYSVAEQPILTGSVALQMKGKGVLRAGERIRSYCRERGAVATCRFLMSRVYRSRRYLVFEATLEKDRACPEWSEDERLQILSRENLDAALTPEITSFLGGTEADEHLRGVRTGDLLFLVMRGVACQHCGYILFETRQTRILGEQEPVPLIASCKTAPESRGRGLYRRALQAELCHLRTLGFQRAVIETDPDNAASRKGIEAAGFRLCRQVKVWLLLNWLVCQHVLEGSHARWRVFAV
jgi:predicted N-acetyltransferase YhbS